MSIQDDVSALDPVGALIQPSLAKLVLSVLMGHI